MHWHEQKKHKSEKFSAQRIFSATFRDTCHPSHLIHAILQAYLLCLGCFLDSHAHQQTQELQSNWKSKHLKHCQIIAFLATEKPWTVRSCSSLEVTKQTDSVIQDFKALSVLCYPCVLPVWRTQIIFYTKIHSLWPHTCTVKGTRTLPLGSQTWNSLLQHILNSGLHQERQVLEDWINSTTFVSHHKVSVRSSSTDLETDFCIPYFCWQHKFNAWRS